MSYSWLTTQMPEWDQPELADRWRTLRGVRGEGFKVMEVARVAKCAQACPSSYCLYPILMKDLLPLGPSPQGWMRVCSSRFRQGRGCGTWFLHCSPMSLFRGNSRLTLELSVWRLPMLLW